MELTIIEKLALRGVVARDNEIQEKMVKPLQKDYQDLARSIEARLGLESGDIGKKFAINVQTMTLDELKQPEPPTPPEQAESGND